VRVGVPFAYLSGMGSGLGDATRNDDRRAWVGARGEFKRGELTAARAVAPFASGDCAPSSGGGMGGFRGCREGDAEDMRGR
jgi:hypothetical protein